VIDVAMILCLTYALTLSRPKDELTTERPTSSLLGPHTFLSITGTTIINAIFMGISLGVMAADPEYIKWPNKCSDANFWYLLADNWETTVICVLFLYQVSSLLAKLDRSHPANAILCSFLCLSLPSHVIGKEKREKGRRRTEGKEGE
jgi:hypothetical protein